MKPSSKSKKKDRPLTKAEFEYFSKCCYEFIEDFGCKQYNVTIDIEDLKDSDARVVCSQENAYAAIEVHHRVRWHWKNVRAHLRRNALHECLHILFSNYRWLSECRFNVAEEDIYGEEEKIIRVFEKLL